MSNDGIFDSGREIETVNTSDNPSEGEKKEEKEEKQCPERTEGRFLKEGKAT